jgi:hypothetical protein
MTSKLARERHCLAGWTKAFALTFIGVCLVVPVNANKKQ